MILKDDKIKKYPTLNYFDNKYWNERVLGCLIFILIVITYLFISKKAFTYLIFANIQLLFLYAVIVRQKILIQYIDNIISTRKNDISDKLIVNTNNVVQITFPSWGFYVIKFRKLRNILSNLFIVYAVIIFLYIKNNNLVVKLNYVPFIIIVYCLYYVKANYLQSYLRKTVVTNELILSTVNESTPSMGINWPRNNRRKIMDWSISGIIVLLGTFLYSFQYIDLFSFIIIFVGIAFLYPPIRLTIDLNIQFNRFSSALEKATADLFKEKNGEDK